jgi:hypothetical protein
LKRAAKVAELMGQHHPDFDIELDAPYGLNLAMNLAAARLWC